jgi:hypothetical protein
MLSCRAAEILKKKLVHLVVSVLELIKPVVKNSAPFRVGS